MKVIMGQINTTPCDFAGNLAQIIAGIQKATDDTKLIVFPEMSIPGYLCQDLLYDESFIEKNYESVGEIKAESKKFPNLRIVVGCVDVNTRGMGKPFTNMALVIHNGFVVARYNKQLLPFYDVFDEGRYFEPGKDTTVFEIDGNRFGLSICEDLWNDKEQEQTNYPNNPVQRYRDLGIDCLINISSSPYCKNKPFIRQQMIEKIAPSFPKGIIYVNQVGGQDELVFDGCSTYVVKANTNSVHTRVLMDMEDSSPSYREFEFYPDSRSNNIDTRDYIRHSNKYVKKMLVTGLRDYLKKSGFSQIVLGSSGGIDSAIVACLAAEAIGPENVHCIMMPSIHSSDHSLSDAKQLHKNIGCHEYEVPISHIEVVEGLKGRLIGETPYNSVADENIQARIRGSYVMWFSNATGALTLTTGNKTELAIGYATLYGDMCGGYAPICDMYKMEIYALAKEFYKKWIPENIITKEPSAELAEGQFDSNELLPYVWLDAIVEYYIEGNIHNWEIFRKLVNCEEDGMVKVTKEDYNNIIIRIDNNEFKRRQYAPGTKISRKSFGIGRRIPIVKGRKCL